MKGQAELQHAFLRGWSKGRIQTPIIKLDLAICSDCGLVSLHAQDPKELASSIHIS